jgi:hypothetical protein
MRSKASLLLLAVTLSACSANAAKVAQTSSPTPSGSPTASPTPSPTPAPTGDPLTGMALSHGPVVAVKIDNAPLARPYQRGLRQGAIVYQELVEGGLTRLMVVFESSGATSEVGPVRSGRETDIDILREYRRPALAFSGAQPGVFALIRAAASRGWLINASYNAATSQYRLGERRRDARNFFVVPSSMGRARGGGQPQDIGLRFGTRFAGVPTTTARAVFSPTSVVKVRYNPATGRYVITQGGRTVPVSPANIIVQYVSAHPSRFHDVHGMNTPLTISTGGGRSYVLRDGLRVNGTWKRSGYGATHFRDTRGHDVLLKPGPTWVFLLPRSGAISFG